MKLGITGSRTVENYGLVADAIKESPFDPTKIIHGGAGGVDSHADTYANLEGIDVDVIRPDDPTLKYKYLERNEEIVERAEALVAVWGSHPDKDQELSNGTRDTIEKAIERGKDVFIKSAMENQT